ncbi:MAG: hypothetical protein QOI04_250 [Verrucomicrobiota bacterium]
MRSLFFVGSALLLIALAPATHAGRGHYQRTIDGKGKVWNNRPLPGDTAEWTGDRDLDGYATGYGTLTWSRREQKVRTGTNIPVPQQIELTRYSGMMIHGRLDGPVVNVDANGKTFHGTFADGRKTKDWKPGPAPSPSETEVAANETAPAESVARDSNSSASEPLPPGAGPSQNSDRSRMPAAEQHRSENMDRDTVVETPAAAPSPSPIARPKIVKQEPVIQEPAHDISAPALSIEEPRHAGPDDSLRALMSPPSLLRKNPGVESTLQPSVSAPPAPTTTTSTSPAPAVSNKPKLAAADVVELSDAEARAQGYELREFQRSQVRYNSKDQTWSVSYDQKTVDSNAMGEMDNNFTVTVEDKTRKVELKK